MRKIREIKDRTAAERLVDKIGREALIDKISRHVHELPGGKHYVLAINGDHGSGKSFVMKMLEDQFEQDDDCFVIRYDAWKNTFYDDPLIAILSCLIDGLRQNRSLRQERCKAAAKEAAEGLLDIVKSCNIISIVRKSVRGMEKIIENYVHPFDFKVEDDFIAYETLLTKVKDLLERVTTPVGENKKPCRLVLLVDEIDRCLPETQLKILERLHHVMDVRNSIVIVAINQKVISKTINSFYGISGEEYLTKFFDLTYYLDTSADIYLTNLLKDFCLDIKIANCDDDRRREMLNVVTERLVYRITAGKLMIDNRDLDRYMNDLKALVDSLQRSDQKYEDLYSWFFVIIGLFIRKFIDVSFPNLGKIRDVAQKALLETCRQNPFATVSTMQPSDWFNPYFSVQKSYTSAAESDKPDADINPMIKDFADNFNKYLHCAAFYHEDSLSSNRYGIKGYPQDYLLKCRELCRLIAIYGGEQERHA